MRLPGLSTDVIRLGNRNAQAYLNATELKHFNALLFLREHFHVWLECFFFLSDWGSQLYNSQGLCLKPFK